ncbi:MAG TPA: gamma-glutamyl-gamma-aminobutyrate hydrolase family protein [Tepidisphaeraceae bacterium]|jgi:putative glutamine amidotransferase
MSLPRIGITVDTHDRPEQYESPTAYATSVEKAGGLPFLLPYRTDISLISQYIDTLDGILLSGGNDLDPSLYGEPYHPKAVPIDPARQGFETALLAEVERRRMPVLGICLGSQLMNVFRGGSLTQFIPGENRTPQIEHRKTDDIMPRHAVRVNSDSLVAKAVGKTDINANSSHKQAVKNVGRGLRIIGTAPDGIIEGIEDPSFPLFLGVQWHPERLHNEPDHLALFRLLVERAAESKA